MASENFPSAEEPKPTPEPPKSNLRSFIVGALIIALLATWGYIIWDKSKTQESLNNKDKEITTAISQKDTLQSLLNDATNRYDELKTTDTKKDSSIEVMNKEIADKKARIQNLLTRYGASKDSLAAAKGLIASLNDDISGYKTQIDSLKTQNTQLTVEKAAVTQERDVVQKSLDSTQQVVKQKDDVIDIGSTLHASNFNILGIDQKSNGSEKETSNAKKSK